MPQRCSFHDGATVIFLSIGIDRLKLFHSNIQDGYLDILQNDISLTTSQIQLKLGGRHRDDMEIQNC